MDFNYYRTSTPWIAISTIRRKNTNLIAIHGCHSNTFAARFVNRHLCPYLEWNRRQRMVIKNNWIFGHTLVLRITRRQPCVLITSLDCSAWLSSCLSLSLKVPRPRSIHVPVGLQDLTEVIYRPCHFKKMEDAVYLELYQKWRACHKPAGRFVRPLHPWQQLLRRICVLQLALPPIPELNPIGSCLPLFH